MEIEYYAVYADNTLGYVFTDTFGMKNLGILHASVLKGSHFNGLSNALHIGPPYSLRKATKSDFDNYRVCLPPDFNEKNNLTNQ